MKTSELIVLWKVQNRNIESSGHNAYSAPLNRRDVRERSIYGSCRFDIGRSRASRLITKVSIPGVRYLHIAVPTITRSCATRNPRVKKTAAYAWVWYQRWLRRSGTRISVSNIPSGKIGLPFQMFRCSKKFSAVTTQKVVFHLHSSQTFKILFVNDKQPRYYLWENQVKVICKQPSTRHKR